MDIHERDTLGAFMPQSPARREGAADGPLAGVAFGLKDLFDVAGVPTGFGHPAWLASHPVPDRDSVVLTRLLAAGAQLVGKTHCDELCYSLNGANTHYGTPVNRAAPGRLPGGSSSGSAAAVAGALVPLAIGSDTGGSVRVPASYCGVIGMRTTHGAVPLDGAVPFAPSYDTVGWFTRDVALFEKVGRVLLADDAVAPAPGRLLIAGDAFAHALPETALALRAALAPIAQRLASVAEVTLAEEGLASWMQDFRLIQGSEIWATHRDWIGSLKPGFGGGIRERFDWVSTLTDDQVAPARRRRGDIAARLHTLLANDAVLAIPTVIGIAPLCATPVAELEAWRNRCIGLLCIAGHAGLPQLSLPLAVVDGCPVGLSLIAAPGRDSMLLALARELMG
ncbi:MAG: amidase [Burkholderiales bacterium]|nr:amidase [Burkholderiales bacterium]